MIGLFLLSAFGVRPALSQGGDAQSAKKRTSLNTDVSVGVFGQLTPTRSPVTTTSDSAEITQTTQGTSPSAGVLVTMDQSVKPWLGYKVNFGYSRFSENYSQGHEFVTNATPPVPTSSYFTEGSIGTNMYETSIAYAIQGPRTERFSTFAQLGGGGLFFRPTQNQSLYHNQVRPAMLFGVGVNYHLTERLAVRAEYRGLFYKNPDFAYYSGNSIPISKLFTVTNEPTVSLVYTFGAGKRKGQSKAH